MVLDLVVKPAMEEIIDITSSTEVGGGDHLLNIIMIIKQGSMRGWLKLN